MSTKDPKSGKSEADRRPAPVQSTMLNQKTKGMIEAFVERVKGKPAKSQQMLALSELSRIYRRKQSNGDLYAVTTNRRLITEYRNALRVRYGDNAPILRWMRYSDVRTTEFKSDQQDRTMNRHQNQRPLDLDLHLFRARALLTSVLVDQWYTAKAMAAVVALTGRRPYEVGVTGRFEPDPDDPTLISFTGQAKTRDKARAEQAYTIPVLADRHLVLQAHERILAEVGDLPNAKFNSRFAKEMGKASANYFRDDKNEPITPRALREAYTASAYWLFAPDGVSQLAYYNEILGHQDKTMESTHFYFDFYIKVKSSATEAE